MVWTATSYRIGLRTFSESESSVVPLPDAFHLPATRPGYLKVDTSSTAFAPATFWSWPGAAGAGWTQTPAAAAMLLPTFNNGLAKREADDQEQELTRPLAGRWWPSASTGSGSPAARCSRYGCRHCPRGSPIPRTLRRRPRDDGALLVPMGLLDNPAKQRQQLVARLEQGRRSYRGAGRTAVRPQHLLAHHGSVGGTDPYPASS